MYWYEYSTSYMRGTRTTLLENEIYKSPTIALTEGPQESQDEF